MTPISKAEYARLRGLARSTVSRQVAAGFIEVDAAGRIDPEVADRARKERLDPSRGRPAEKNRKSEPRSGRGFAAARERREIALAGMAEFELKVRRLEFVDAAEIEREIAGIVLMARNRFLSFPSKAAPVVAGLGILAAQEFLKKEIDSILTDLADGAAGLVDNVKPTRKRRNTS